MRTRNSRQGVHNWHLILKIYNLINERKKKRKKDMDETRMEGRKKYPIRGAIRRISKSDLEVSDGHNRIKTIE